MTTIILTVTWISILFIYYKAHFTRAKLDVTDQIGSQRNNYPDIATDVTSTMVKAIVKIHLN